ncbi:ImmA/IrrE family metallo-endopeptidase [Blautia schinkii]|nr:ImmA/IrrE family metallo-endopeptidase [Blautia schinkii]
MDRFLMGNVLENSLFVQKRDKFEELSKAVESFNVQYNGSNIIQDDIFSVLKNYARTKEIELESLRFPTKDDDFCALTCIKKGKIFVYVNSWLPLSKQIFAAAHELYHIWCYIEEKDTSVLRKGSFLNASDMDEDVKSNEDREANAFSGLLLVPPKLLFEQMNIYRISRENQNLEDVIQLMAIFSVPFKAILLRLYEERFMDINKVKMFLEMNKESVKKAIDYVADAQRWQRRTPEIIQMGNLKRMLDQNQEHELLAASRIKSDKEILEEILQRHTINRG